MFNNIYKFDIFLNLNYYNLLFLFFIFIFSSIFLILNFFFNINFKMINFKNFILFFYTLSFIMFLFYIFIFVHFKSILLIKNFIYFDYSFNYLTSKMLDVSSIIIIYLCYLIGFISILTLGDRFWGANYQLSLLFIYFIIIINLLCQSFSLFELFMYYELLLLPSILFIHKFGYTKKSHQSNIYFFLWTQLGSLIVLLGILYISSVCGSTDFSFIKNFYFTNLEVYYLYLLFFFGFGVKVPLWPLHFWLIKVHVEAPSGFSIFLSGFLVKSAVYCFYKIITIFNIKYFFVLPIIICILGMLDASLKMWSQMDIKKLIAYATVQEMNAIYLLFNLGDSWAINVGLIFLLAHGILSAMMFFLIECIYKRLNTRSLYKIYGIAQIYPNLSLAIWIMLILFFGFPGTLKFYVEIQLVFILAHNDIISTFFILIVFIFINAVGFGRCWFSILYGHYGYDKEITHQNMDLTSEETLIILLLTFLSITPCFFIFLF